MIPDKLIKSFSVYPALWFFAIYSFGIICGWYFLENISIKLLVYFVFSLCLIAIFLHLRSSQFFLSVILLLIFVLGMSAIYQSLAQFNLNDLCISGTKNMQSFRGWISETHYRKDGNHQYIMELTMVERDSQEQPAYGKILIKQRRLSGKLQYGDIIKVIGKPELPQLPSNPGEFNYRRYLQLNDIYYQYYLNNEQDYQILQGKKGSAWQKYLIQPVRNKIINILDDNVAEPTVDILKALILGEKQNIDSPILVSFQRSGVIHVLAISGLHVGFILLVFLMIFSLFNVPYRLKIILTLILLFIYVALVNFKAPVLRASIMAAFYFLGNLAERRGNSMNIIGLAGLIILAFDPRQLFQVGFQFSFAAVGSILYGYPKLSGLLPRASRFKWASSFNKILGRPFIVSIAAVLGTTPLTWWYYGTFQLGALLINLLVIPAIGLLVISSFILIAIGLLGFGFAGGLGTLLNQFFIFILEIITFFSSLPFVQILLPNPPVTAILILSLAVLLFFKLNNFRRIIYPAILLMFIFLILAWPGQNNKLLQVTFVSVGQGDGSIIRFPNQSVMVMDAGENNPGLNAGERYMLPLLRYYGIKQIKYLVGTHAHSDHIGGFVPILNNIKVDTLVLPGYRYDSKLFHTILLMARSKNIPVLFKRRGDRLYPDPECRAYFLHPFGRFLQNKDQSGHEVNNSSLVTKIEYAQTAFLFTGDLETDAEQVLLNYKSFLHASVIKVGHHGSKTSTGDAFLSFIQPDYSVISVGRFNKFFHPSRRTVERLRVNSAHPLRTDYFGGLVFRSDGREVKLINWRD